MIYTSLYIMISTELYNPSCSSFNSHFNSDALMQEKETMQQIQMLDETMKVHRLV
jgi:hypothetical protein